ncbi:MAG: glycoside hydrolase family 15 [Nanoarchaeota archaeon]|nr:glycoside hydrolase family 15 [Nanoarchaeota archaeon]
MKIPFVKRICLHHLKKLRYSSGLFAAASRQVRTGYNKAWLRDNVYEALGLENAKDITSLKKTYAALFDILLKHEKHIEEAIKHKPHQENGYIHARYCPFTLEKFDEPWGNKQNDAIGAFLFKVADLEKKGISVIRDHKDMRILRKLVHYLKTIEYWHDKDNGMWEENMEVHASSVGACVAGLKAIKDIIRVPESLIYKGQKALDKLLPRESETKHVDLALLSLIYPYDVLTEKQRDMILDNVETFLVRDRGVIRYIGDQYYSNGKEAEWTFGFPWLARIYKDLDKKRYRHYLMKSLQVMNWKGEMPELYFGESHRHNCNTPLGWAQALVMEAV